MLPLEVSVSTLSPSRPAACLWSESTRARVRVHDCSREAEIAVEPMVDLIQLRHWAASSPLTCMMLALTCVHGPARHDQLGARSEKDPIPSNKGLLPSKLFPVAGTRHFEGMLPAGTATSLGCLRPLDVPQYESTIDMLSRTSSPAALNKSCCPRAQLDSVENCFALRRSHH